MAHVPAASAGTLNDIAGIVLLHAAMSIVSPFAAGCAAIALIVLLGAGNEITFRRFARPVQIADLGLVPASLSFAGWGDLRLTLRWMAVGTVAAAVEEELGERLAIAPGATFLAMVAGGAALLLLAIGIEGRRPAFPDNQKASGDLRSFLADGMLAFFARSAVQALTARRARPVLPSFTPASASTPAETAPGGVKPDVVVVVLESFFDIERSPLFSHRSLLPALRRLTADGRAWDAVPPVLGGKTANTEFEVLSGIPTACVPGADVPFRDLALDKEEALPRALKRLGYDTTALHPGIRRFWNRHAAYPALGFDRYLSLESFQGARRIGSYVETDEVVARIETLLAAADGPQFVYAVSILGHGPYDTDVEPRFPVDLPEGLSDEVRRYCHLLTHADAALDRLATFVKTRKRPTVALVLGDHAPGFNGSVGLGQLGFDCRRAGSGAQPSAYSVPLVQISNIPLPEPEHLHLPTHLLGGYLFSQLGFSDPGRIGTLAGLLQGRRTIDPFADATLAPLASPKDYLRVFSDALSRQIRMQELLSAFDEAAASPGNTDRLTALIGMFDNYLTEFGDDAVMFYRKGVLECLNERFFDAERDINRAIEIGGVDHFWSRYWRGRAYLGRAAFYPAQCDFEDCARTLEMSIIEMAVNRDDRLFATVALRAEVEEHLAAARRETVELYRAIAREAAEKGEDGAYAFAVSRVESELPGPAAFIRGIHHARKGEWAQARAHFTTAIRHDGQDFWAHVQRANCHVRLGDIPSALHDLDCADRITPDTQVVLEMRRTLQPPADAPVRKAALS